MARLNIERQNELTPERMAHAIEEVEKLGYEIFNQTDTFIQFTFKGSLVTHYVYSGWHTGKTIRDGRGLQNLLNQLKQ